MENGKEQGVSYQNVVVMRHGDRIDNFEPLWVTTTDRPWDPPLVEKGRIRAFCTGRKLRNLGFPIHRVFVSPFIRCIQTASEVVSVLCAIDEDPNATISDEVSIDASNIKVAVEYGLCEVLNREAIRNDYAPKDGNCRFNISEIEAALPAGSVDHSLERVYKGLPQWGETMTAAKSRYEHIIKALADKYPSENLLLVTHGEGVGVAVSAFFEGSTVYEVEYCAFAELRRPILNKEEAKTAGDFEVLTKPGQNGIGYLPGSTASDVKVENVQTEPIVQMSS